MTETHSLPVISLEGPQGTLGQLQARRAAFIENLRSRGLLSEQLISSGDLDMFAIDIPTQHDSLMHILIGDEHGGAHHLRTMMDAELPQRVVASSIKVSDNHGRNNLRKKQSIRSNGVFRPKIVEINGQEKLAGSAMFPNEWSTEDVVKAIVKVAKSAPEKHDFERASYTHNGEVDRVQISVITGENSGKIITASPKVSTK